MLMCDVIVSAADQLFIFANPRSYNHRTRQQAGRSRSVPNLPETSTEQHLTREDVKS